MYLYVIFKNVTLDIFLKKMAEKEKGKKMDQEDIRIKDQSGEVGEVGFEGVDYSQTILHDGDFVDVESLIACALCGISKDM